MRRLNFVFLFIFTALATFVDSKGLLADGVGKPPEAQLSAQNGVSIDHSHALWDGILKQYVVVDGPMSRVKYTELKQNRSDLDSYLGIIQAVTRDQFLAFSEPEKLAFLINAYNAFTVKLILDHYPVKSIKDIGGLFSSPWKIAFFTLFGENHSLDDIEQSMIRKDFHEPRIHFALVCASKGCPALRAEAYVAARLDSQLDDAAHTFLNDTAKNHFDAAQSTLYLSSIFKWYGDDFKKNAGTVPAFPSRPAGIAPGGPSLTRTCRFPAYGSSNELAEQPELRPWS